MCRKAAHGRPRVGRKAHASASLAVGLAALFPGVAAAQNQNLPFSDPHEVQEKGKLQVEQTLDASPVRVRSQSNPAEGEHAAELRLPTELSYGLGHRVQVTDLLILKQAASTDPSLSLDAAGLRLQVLVAEKGELPIDVAFWVQALGHFDGVGGQGRLLLAKSFDPVTIRSNLWLEASARDARDGVLATSNGSLGAEAKVGDVTHLGAETWVVDRFGNAEPEAREEPAAAAFNERPHAYVGPVVSFDWKKVYWTTGVYLRLDELDRESQPGDMFGRFWLRSLLGVSP